MKNRSRKLNKQVLLEKENLNRDTLRNLLVHESKLASGSSKEILEEYDRLPDWIPTVLFHPITIRIHNSYFVIRTNVVKSSPLLPSLSLSYLLINWNWRCWMTVEDIRPEGIRSENIRRRHSNSSSPAAPLSLPSSPTLERSSESPDCCIQHTVSATGCGRRRWARACSFSCRQAQGFE